MSRPNVLVTRPIMDEPLARLRERCDVTVHENEFGIPREELLQVVAGRDALIMMLGQDVHHKTIGIVGFGRIGQAVARRAKGFGMTVLYSDAIQLPASVEAE